MPRIAAPLALALALSACASASQPTATKAPPGTVVLFETVETEPPLYKRLIGNSPLGRLLPAFRE